MDYAGIALLGVVVTVMLMIILYRSLVTIPPGQEGLVYLMGRYRKTLSPGFWAVNPYSVVLKVSSTQSGEIGPGAVGIVDVPVDTAGYNGRVRVGNTILAARSSRTIPAGSRVRLVSAPRPIEVVEVEPEGTPLAFH